MLSASIVGLFFVSCGFRYIEKVNMKVKLIFAGLASLECCCFATGIVLCLRNLESLESQYQSMVFLD